MLVKTFLRNVKRETLGEIHGRGDERDTQAIAPPARWDSAVLIVRLKNRGRPSH